MVGLRLGCSLTPLVFRWVMEELMAEARELWTAAGVGLHLDTDVLQVLGWENDKCFLAEPHQSWTT